MNKRTLIIAGVFIVPVLVIAAISHYNSRQPGGSPVPVSKVAGTGVKATAQRLTLEKAREATKARLDYLNKMTPQEWEAQRQKFKIPFSLEEARGRNQRKLQHLMSIDERQWEQETATQAQMAARRAQAARPAGMTPVPAQPPAVTQSSDSYYPPKPATQNK